MLCGGRIGDCFGGRVLLLPLVCRDDVLVRVVEPSLLLPLLLPLPLLLLLLLPLLLSLSDEEEEEVRVRLVPLPLPLLPEVLPLEPLVRVVVVPVGPVVERLVAVTVVGPESSRPGVGAKLTRRPAIPRLPEVVVVPVTVEVVPVPVPLVVPVRDVPDVVPVPVPVVRDVVVPVSLPLLLLSLSDPLEADEPDEEEEDEATCAGGGAANAGAQAPADGAPLAVEVVGPVVVVPDGPVVVPVVCDARLVVSVPPLEEPEDEGMFMIQIATTKNFSFLTCMSIGKRS
jgi:hypothetical protein